MISSILIGALLGAGGGLLGGLLAYAVHKGVGAEGVPPRWPATLGVFLAIALTRPITAYFNKPTLVGMMAEIEKSQPVYAALRQFEPDAYAQVQAIVGAALDQEQPNSDWTPKIRNVISLVSAQRMKTASDTQLLNASSLISDEMMEMSRTSPTTCVQYLAGGANIVPFITAELAERDSQFTSDLISKPGSSRELLSETEMTAIIAPMLSEIAVAQNMSQDEVAKALNGSGTEVQRCTVSADLFRRLGRVPNNKGATALRTLINQS